MSAFYRHCIWHRGISYRIQNPHTYGNAIVLINWTFSFWMDLVKNAANITTYLTAHVWLGFCMRHRFSFQVFGETFHIQNQLSNQSCNVCDGFFVWFATHTHTHTDYLISMTWCHHSISSLLCTSHFPLSTFLSCVLTPKHAASPFKEGCLEWPWPVYMTV